MAAKKELVPPQSVARDRHVVPDAVRGRLRPFLKAHRSLWTIAMATLKALVWVRALLCHRLLVGHYLRTQRPLKLHLGCGPNVLPGWLNTDLNPGVVIVSLDASKPLPFANRTFDYAFTEHMIEHLKFKKGEQLIREIFRVLKAGGKLRISTPDLKFLIDLYADKKSELQGRYINWTGETFLSDINPCTDTHVINNFFRDWDHKFIYDDKTLREVLSNSGFVNVERREVGESHDVHLRNLESHGTAIGDEFNRLESLIMEATRPLES